MGVYFLSFANSEYKSINRIIREAVDSKMFDVVIGGDENVMLEPWYKNKYKDRFKDRGFGYWQWKPYLIRRVLEQMDENDILVYTDAGCTINKNGRNRFDEYTQNSLESYCLSRV